MTYTVITKTGRVLVFTVQACAEIYVSAYGGVMITNEIVVCCEIDTVCA